MKRLSDILKGLEVEEVAGSTAVAVNHITNNSRDIQKNTLFVAVRGTKVDGHAFIGQAVDAGAVAVCCETFPQQRAKGITWIRVRQPASTLGLMSAALFDHPSKKLHLVGVTGTNGKTTSATLLYHLLEKMGHKSGLISTVVYRVGEKVMDSTHTTPDAVVLNRLLYEMIQEGTEYCFMEVSSHALVQERTAGLQFTGGIFTNITHDHLDYHLTFSDYIRAKKKFFDALHPHAFALVNNDDRNAKVMVQNCRARIRTYALKSMADYRCRIIESGLTGMLLRTNGDEWWSRLMGEFNAYNLLAVYSCALEMGLPREEVIRVLSNLEAVNGRFETIRSADGRLAVVDYAHSPDALENILRTLQEMRKEGHKIITVVGAGGDRDRKKRPVMARIAAAYSNKVILTSDNPRSEDPAAIIDEMKAGLTPVEMNEVLTIVNRRDAIQTATMMAGTGDIILVAGKGHETYQEIKGVRHHFDDREIIRELFNIKT